MNDKNNDGIGLGTALMILFVVLAFVGGIGYLNYMRPASPACVGGNCPEPPTDTPVPPTDTDTPPTETNIPPTETSVPPTDTDVPTDTPLPTATSTFAIATINVPTRTPTQQSAPSDTAQPKPSATLLPSASPNASATPLPNVTVTPAITATPVSAITITPVGLLTFTPTQISAIGTAVTVMPTTLPTSDSSNGATTEEILPKTGIGDDLRTLAFAAIALLVIITIVRLLRWSVTHQDN